MTPTWQTADDSIRLYLGDCLDVLPQLEAGSVDAVVTDLPYGTTANAWDEVIDSARLWDRIEACMKATGVFATTSSQPFASMLVASNPDDFRHEWIWIKNRGSNFANTVREPFKEHEHVLVFSRGGWTYNPQSQRRAESGLSRVQHPINSYTDSDNYRKMRSEVVMRPDERVPSSWQKFNTEVGLHPTQKPLPLFDYLVRTYTNEGDAVADVAMGSGTTGVACIRTGRRFIGIEKEPRYFDIACRRIEAELNRTALLEPPPKVIQRTFAEES